MSKTIFLFFLVSALLLSPFRAQAADPPPLSKGPLTIGSTGRFTATYTFAATAGASAILTITKTTAAKAITSGYVTLNYVRTNLPAFPVGGATVFEKQITLKASNRLTLSLTGTQGASVTLVVRPGTPPMLPTATLTANPLSVTYGNTSTLSWTSVNATSVTIDNGIGTVALNGALVVRPQRTTTYTLTATGPGGTASAGVTVTVIIPAPTVKFWSTPRRVQAGEIFALAWQLTDTDAVNIEPGIGQVDFTWGGTPAQINQTTTFTITATGPGGSATAQTTVIVGLEGAPRVPTDYPTLQAAVEAAPRGEVIIVADGTYSGTGNTNINIMGKDINIYSENGPANCIIDGQGAGRGFSFSGTSYETYVILKGFTIINGRADNGGAIFLKEVDATFLDCRLLNNSAANDGGGIYIDDAHALIQDCVISGNTAGRNGAGINVGRYGCIELLNSQVLSNVCGLDGGGLYINDPGDIYLNNSIIAQNTAQNGFGAGFYQVDGFVRIINCTITGNRLNSKTSYGVVFHKDEEDIFYTGPPRLNIVNSIIWGNAVYPETSWSSIGTAPAITYSQLEASYTGAGNKTGNPFFKSEGDYHLLQYSPCLDAGTAVTDPGVDIDGETRPLDGGMDIGADELQREPFISAFNVSANTIDEGQSVKLYWGVYNADTITLNPGNHSLPRSTTNPPLELTPSETTTYTLSATGYGKTVTATQTVTVKIVPPPAVVLTTDKTRLQVGDKVTLSWSSTNAATASLNGGGSLQPNGSLVLSPTQTTTYTISVRSAVGKTATASITVYVTAPMPEAALKASTRAVRPGDPVSLAWSSRNAEQLSLIPDIGTLGSPNGTITLNPATTTTTTTTYTLLATGLGMTATAKVTIYVNADRPFDYGDPTPGQQLHLEYINRARANPLAEAARLGIDLNEGLTPETISPEPVQPLTFNALLKNAACGHCQDMVLNSYYGHQSPDGRMPVDRVNAAGYHSTHVSENLCTSSEYFDPQDEASLMLEFQNTLFIDLNYPGRGHRANILWEHSKEAGFCMAEDHGILYPRLYKFTCDFGYMDPSDRFVLGVVYDDRDNDLFYDVGEGLGNVSIEVIGHARTTTASAGGYGLLVVPGAYQVQAVLPDGRRSNKKITVNEKNVKVDFHLSEFAYAPPSVVITAEPQVIRAGQTVLLRWDIADALVASLDNSLGHIPLNGQRSVAPTVTTTYTITATGNAGSQTAAVTVYVDEIPPAPVVSLRAEPAIFRQSGDPVVLSWSSSNAQQLSIDQGVGAVGANGSITVSPGQNITYTLTATGPGGVAKASVTVKLYSVITLEILEPAANSSIIGSQAWMRGSFATDANQETGITVNGIPAMINGNQFAAGPVPLQQGENLLTARAADSAGHTTEASVWVHAETEAPAISVTVTPQSGIAPFETTLIITGPAPLQTSGVSVDGPAQTGVTQIDTATYTLGMGTPGLYTVHVSATDGENRTYAAETAVQVLDRIQVDGLLQSRWSTMKSALTSRDIPVAVSLFADATKPLYNEIYTTLNDRLPAIAAAMQPIELVSIEDDVAIYRIRKNEFYNGSTLTITYYLYFAKDDQGVWKILRY